MTEIELHIASSTFDIGSKINHLLVGLDNTKNNDGKKILELCQFGKLLSTYFVEYDIIDGNREEPDFIIENENEKVGIELMRIFDIETKIQEGYFETICNTAQKILEVDSNFPNFLICVYIHPNLKKCQSLKKKYVDILVDVVKDLVLNNKFTKNELVSHATINKHSQKSIYPNLGAYFQKTITEHQIIESIKSKEKKLPTYIENSVSKQWLVLVIGNVGASSLEVSEMFEMNTIETNFDRVFLYEDFGNKLFELNKGCKLAL